MVQSISLRQGIPRAFERGVMDWKPDFQIQFDGLMRSEVVMPPVIHKAPGSVGQTKIRMDDSDSIFRREWISPISIKTD